MLTLANDLDLLRPSAVANVNSGKIRPSFF